MDHTQITAAAVAEAIEIATAKERKRCADILRSLIHRVESGEPVVAA